MKEVILVSLLAGLLVSSPAEGGFTSSVWAVLVAGSEGWSNYRHQADVAHAYHLFLEKGVPKERIILMMVDDIANHPRNNPKGSIINKPNGTNLYTGLNIDYRGTDVNPTIFKHILLGNKEAVKGNGTGRVLESGPNDHVFINFVDHGSTGYFLFPSDTLTAEDLLATFKEMKEKQKYGQIVFFVEACESGSMFQNLLGHNDKIFVTTAAGADEPSWAWYCDTGLCFGDLYSISWLERLENMSQSETLLDFSEAVKKSVNKSHVQFYGDYRVGYINFGGYGESYEKPIPQKVLKNDGTPPQEGMGVNNRDVPIFMAKKEMENLLEDTKLTNDAETYRKLLNKQAELETLLKGRSFADNLMTILAQRLATGNNVLRDELESVRLNLNKDAFKCHNNLVSTFSKKCFNINKHYYFLKYLYVFANYCVLGLDETLAVRTIESTCQDAKQNSVFENII